MNAFKRFLLSSLTGIVLILFTYAVSNPPEEWEPSVMDYMLPVGVVTLVFFYLVSVFSSKVTKVSKDNEGNPIPKWEKVNNNRSTMGVILLIGGLGMGALMLYKWGMTIGVGFMGGGIFGLYLVYTKMCPFCKKIHNFNEGKCRNCERALDKTQ